MVFDVLSVFKGAVCFTFIFSEATAGHKGLFELLTSHYVFSMFFQTLRGQFDSPSYSLPQLQDIRAYWKRFRRCEVYKTSEQNSETAPFYIEISAK